MAKLIFRSNYFKNEPAVHKSNYIKYLGTREGVEMNPELMPRFFFEDRDMHGKKENYVDYISGRPGVAYVDGYSHGLFSEQGMNINLEQVMDEVANHKGNVWINVISLKREDAARLGYEDVRQWQDLIRSHTADISNAFGIEPRNLRWYAAFHNEGHHPHAHLVVYSEDGEGFISKKGISSLKSAFANEVFRNELTVLYDEKTKQRQRVKQQAKESLLDAIKRMNGVQGNNPEINQMLIDLGKRLKGIKGKKVYGYLHKDIKLMVDEIVKKLEQIPEVRECYQCWLDYQKTINNYYRDDEMKEIPLTGNKEFKSIKNMIIQEAIKAENITTIHPDCENNIVLNGNLSRLLKKLEKAFNKGTGNGSNNKAINESKSISKEKEKKIALGERADDSENEENKKYQSMSM